MKINTTVNRYLFTELIPPFCLNLMFFTFVFLTTKILDITNLIVNYRIGIGTVVLMLLYTVPYFLVFVIPMSVMMAVLLTFLRLSKDNEIIALKASGVSIGSLLPPVLLFCLLGCLLTGFMSVFGLPWGSLSVKKMTYQIAASHLNIGIKAMTFNDNFKGVMIYVSKVDLKNNMLIDVFIEDQRSENMVSTVVAPRARLLSEPDKLALQLQLYDGTINQVNLKSRSVHSIHYNVYNIALDLKKAVSAARSTGKDEKEMSLSELRRYISSATGKDAQYYLSLIELHKKFSIPFACIVLGFLAVPLGVQSRSAKRSFGLGLGLVFFLVYYLILSAGFVFGEAGVYPPAIGMWAPNIVMGAIGLVLFFRTAREQPVGISFSAHRIKQLVTRFGGQCTD